MATPTPWHYNKASIYWYPEGKTVADGYQWIASTESPDADEQQEQENARLIVQAVNYHDKLVEALHGLMLWTLDVRTGWVEVPEVSRARSLLHELKPEKYRAPTDHEKIEAQNYNG